MRILCLPLYAIHRPSSRYRLFQLLPHWHAAGWTTTLLPAPMRSAGKRLAYVPRLLWHARRHDIIFVQKRSLPQWLLSILARWGKPLVYDLDDAVYLREHMTQGVNQMLGAAHTVICGNATLAEYVQHHTKQIKIVPTVVDTNSYAPAPQKRHPQKKETVIGWLGSDPNRGDFTGMEPVLAALAAKYGDRIALRTVASRALETASAIQQQFVPWTLKGAQAELQQFDIGMMPLDDTPYSRGKCGFKLIQYMSVGAAAVASPVGVNSEIVKEGESGFLADSAEQWIQKLSHLIDNPQVAQQIGQNAVKRIEGNYSINAVMPHYDAIFQAAIRA